LIVKPRNDYHEHPGKPKSLYRTSSTAIFFACQILFSQGIAAASYTGSDSFDGSEQTMLSRFSRRLDHHPTTECETVAPDELHPYKTYTFKTDDSGQLTQALTQQTTVTKVSMSLFIRADLIRRTSAPTLSGHMDSTRNLPAKLSTSPLPVK